MTQRGAEEYIRYARLFQSPLFEVTLKNFNVKRREFCYAGAWSYKVNLASGECRACNSSKPHQNLYQNMKEPIRECAVGNCCRSPYCVNSSHYLSLGDIPELDMPSYAMLRDREEAEWYTPEMKAFLSHKLYENNREYGILKKAAVNMYQKVWYIDRDLKEILKKIINPESRD